MEDKGNRPGVMIYFDDVSPALNCMDDAQCGRLFRAIVSYGKTGEVPSIDGMEGLVFAMLTPKIDRDGRRYAESKEQRQYAVYVREKKRAEEPYLSISEWRLLHTPSNGIGPIPPDNGSYPSTSTAVSTSASTAASASPSTPASPSASASADAYAPGQGMAGGFRGEEGGNTPITEERKRMILAELTEACKSNGAQ